MGSVVLQGLRQAGRLVSQGYGGPTAALTTLVTAQTGASGDGVTVTGGTG